MKLGWILRRAFFLSAFLASAAWAQSQEIVPEPGSNSEAIDSGAADIIVTGHKHPGDPVQDFINGISVDTRGQIARFQKAVCPKSYGLPAVYTEAIEERIRTVARAAGLRVGARDCEANIVIIASDYSDHLVERLRRERPDYFAGMELPDIRKIVQAKGPVRAWHVTDIRGSDGRLVERVPFVMLEGVEHYTGGTEYLDGGISPSRLRGSVRQDLAFSVVLFELGALDGRTVTQVADYAAMRSLARTRDAPATGSRTILSLFEDVATGMEPELSLTDWDAAYLKGLYISDGSLAHQEAAIGRKIVNALEELGHEIRR